ncbi:MAG: hypothetical protein HC836_31265 [Richelia sp. RM2_1_2]|nr:hypothetical protein [Richelia sp. RM2_1_2]
MPSLDQVSIEELEPWIANNHLQNELLVVTDKLDGVSVMLVYNNTGKLQIAYSRGNGVEGQDVTRHIKRIKNLKHTAHPSITVRAEIIIERDVFEQIKPVIEHEANREFKNPRNFVAGQMNASKSLNAFYDYAKIVAYEIVWPIINKTEQLKILTEAGFIVAECITLTGNKINATTLVEHTAHRIKTSEFELDGVVIDVDQIDVRNKLTASKRSTTPNPAYARKFKIVSSDNVAITTVKQVVWRPSKDGYVKPTIILEPVNLVGVTISRATGFNARFIIENCIGIGAEVEIIRSGDVIPYIRRVITPADKPDLPTIDVTLNESGVDFIINNMNDEVNFQKFLFCSRALGIEFFAEKTLQKLFNTGCQNIVDLIKLTSNPTLIAKIIGSEVMANKGVESLKNCLNNIDLAVLGEASGCFGRGIGAKKLRKILDHYNRLNNLTVDDIVQVDGFSEITAKNVVEGVPLFEAFLAEIKGLYTIKQDKTLITPKTGKFTNCVFVFTGFRNADLKTTIEHQGGVVADSISKSTTHIVAKDVNSSSSKIKKAVERGITVISIQNLEDWLNG